MGDTEQLQLIRSRARRSAPGTGDPPAAARLDPVARVVVDTGLPHLDRPFDYAVPQDLADAARPGVRVKVRFAGQDLPGFVVERRASAEHPGRLSPVRRVVSPEPVLTPAVLQVCRAVAERYAGTLGDVLRLAVPPRHAAAERALPVEAPVLAPPVLGPARAWSRYAAGPPFLARVASGQSPWASWLATPAASDAAYDWPVALAEAAGAALQAGRGALLVVPDHRDVARVEAALVAELGAGRHVRLTADQGPQARYTAWLKVLRGHVKVVVGTRAAAFAPVRDLGLVAWWDDGDDLLDEPRAPYPHVRDVLLERARVEAAALLSGGFTRTTPVQLLLADGTLKAIAADRAVLHRVAPRVIVAGEGAELQRDPAAASAHLPSVAWRAAKQALECGPVLVQVPRRGYLLSLSCQTCRAPARCGHCQGPLAVRAKGAPPSCRWCERLEDRFCCSGCGEQRWRSSVVGARRTAEELGRAFPGVPVHTSGSGEVLRQVSATPALVIATPGAEPTAPGGYAAVLLLDAWALLDRPGLTAGEEAVRRWLTAAAQSRGAGSGGVVVLCGRPAHATIPSVEAVVRWDPAWFAERELAERVKLTLPPATRMASVTGSRLAVQQALDGMRLPPQVEVLGPHPHGEQDQLLLRTALEDGPVLTAALSALRATRSVRKDALPLTVRVDPTLA